MAKSKASSPKKVTSPMKTAPAATVADITQLVGKLAPFHLAYDWDNVGHQIGDPKSPVSRVAVGLEVTHSFLQFAEKHQCQALITHHPLIFRATKSIRSSDPAMGRVLEIARRGLSLIVAHTNLDRVLEGTNGILARRMGLESLRILEPTALVDSYKVVVFAPAEYSAKLIEAFHRAGGGRIGAYSRCSFRSPGMGSFQGDEGTSPFFGESGRLEQAPEERLECLVPAERLSAVMAELRAAHPYEEMAADVIPVRDWSMPFGLGVVGEFPGPRVALADVGQLLSKATESTHIQQVGRKPVKGIRRVGIITGSPGPSIHAALAAGVEVLITGELGYHPAMEAADLGMTVLLCGHAASERIFAPEFSQQLARTAGPDLGVEFLPCEDFPEPFSLVPQVS
jgi:dinuclear metal center YbgI/SA1388 family protein